MDGLTDKPDWDKKASLKTDGIVVSLTKIVILGLRQPDF